MPHNSSAPPPIFRVAKLTLRRGLFALLAIGLLAAGVAGFFMSGAVAQAQEQETTLPSSYDTDGDGLIEISNLAQLNAVRWDQNGDGVPDDAENNTAYTAAFPLAQGGEICMAAATCSGYELTANLDFDENGDGEITAADGAYWNDGAGWEPISTYRNVFDGNERTIANLFVDRPTTDLVGLFQVIGTEGSVQDLGLTGVDVRGKSWVGGLAGGTWGPISGSYVKGTVRADGNAVGGLLGYNYDRGTISGSYVEGTVRGNGDMVGGLVGYQFPSVTIRGSYAVGTVTGGASSSLTGGLVGFNKGSIIGSHAEGTVTGGTSSLGTGGLVGTNEGSISGSYVTGTVNGGDTSSRGTGGLVGINKGSISKSYVMGKVTGGTSSHSTGGLVGTNEGSISKSYVMGKVTGGTSSDNTGGLVGVTEIGSTISTSYMAGTVVGHAQVGGLVGLHSTGATISASYATGTVSGSSSVGGLLGFSSGTVNGSYAAGTVRGTYYVGGAVGLQYAGGTHTRTYGTISASYYDRETAGRVDGLLQRFVAGNPSPVGVGSATVEGWNTAELTTPTGYTGIYTTWDDDGDVWNFGTATQYPALKVDLDGDDTATWREFGFQLRERPALTATPTPDGTEMALSWNAVDTSHWTNPPSITYALYQDGEKVTDYDGSSLSYTDTGLTLGQTYVYQVAMLLNGVEAQHSNRAAVTAVSTPSHYDADGDGLIEIDELAQLNAIHWDLDGDGTPATGHEAGYAAAFPVIDGGSVCPSGTTCTGYELTANLDFDENGDGAITAADATYWNNGGGWEPIGLANGQFTGTLDGNGHTISNLYISRRMGRTYADGSFQNIAAQGLFGQLAADAVVRNLGLPRVNVAGEYIIGGLAGRNQGTIDNSYVTGAVSGSNVVGGLAGDNWNVIKGSHAAVSVNGRKDVGGLAGANGYGGVISTSYATGTVSGEKENAGGLVGKNGPLGVITASYAAGDVEGARLTRAGGLAGRNQGTISVSYATGAVATGLGYSGGLVGENSGTIMAAYATGLVSGQRATGSLVGENRGTVNASYSTGPVRSTIPGHRVGGLAGSNSGTITASYLDTQTAGISLATSIGASIDDATISAGNTGKATHELQSPTGYTGIYVGWNIDLDGDGAADNPWNFGFYGSYPALQADFNGDNTATWQEFGYQLRQRPTLTATTTGMQVELTWNDLIPVYWTDTPRVAYVLYRDGERVSGYDGSSLSHADAGLRPGQTYTYQVGILLGNVATQYSNQVVVVAGEGIVPTGPPVLSLSCGDAIEGSPIECTASLSHTARAEVTFRVNTNTGGSFGTATAGADFTAIINDRSFSIPQGETSVAIAVQTVDDSEMDEGDETITVALARIVNATPAELSATATIRDNDGPNPPGQPAAPTLTAPASAASTLQVSWTAPDNTGQPAISNYDVQWREGSSGSWTDAPPGTSDSAATTYTITGLKPNTAYQVRVRAENANGVGSWSDAASETTAKLVFTIIFTGPADTLTIAADGRTASISENAGQVDVVAQINFINAAPTAGGNDRFALATDANIASNEGVAATEGTDYTAPTTVADGTEFQLNSANCGGATFWDQNQCQRTLRITIIQDAADEPDELLNLAANFVRDYPGDNVGFVGVPQRARLTIIDDDN